MFIALRFYATGCFQNLVGEMIGVDKSTASRAIHRVTNAMVALMPRLVYMPTQQEADRQKVKFMRIAGHPNIIGCIDGTHVRIQAPSTNEHEYVNRNACKKRKFLSYKQAMHQSWITVDITRDAQLVKELLRVRKNEIYLCDFTMNEISALIECVCVT